MVGIVYFKSFLLVKREKVKQENKKNLVKMINIKLLHESLH